MNPIHPVLKPLMVAIALLAPWTWAAEADPFYLLKPGDDSWKITWSTNGKLVLDARDGLRARAEGPVKGYVARTFSLQLKSDLNLDVSAELSASSTNGAPLLYVMGRDDKGKTVLYANLGKPSTVKRPFRQMVRLGTNLRSFEVGLAFQGSETEVHLSSLRLMPFVATPEDLAKAGPKGPTFWAATSIDRTYGPSGFDSRWKNTALKLVATAGVLHTRAGINWSTVEKEKGRLDFSEYLDRSAAFERYGIQLSVVCLGGTPSWASGRDPERDFSDAVKKKLGPYKVSNSFWPPRDWGDWERFVEGAVRAAKGRVKAWEILNEPDYPSEGFQGGYEDYREYVRHAFLAARRVDPEARIFLGAFVHNEWMPRLFQDGLAPWFDGMCSHPYASTGEGAVARNAVALLTGISYGTPKEAWITEIGFQSGWKDGPGRVADEAEKAREGRRALEGLAKQSGFIAWYTAQEKGNMFGLSRIEPNGSLRPMPMYHEMGDLTGRLKKAGGPVRLTVSSPATAHPGDAVTVTLRAENTAAAPLAVKLWPIGLLADLGPTHGDPAALDWDGTLKASETRTLTAQLRPDAKAGGTYAIGLAAITAAGNSLALSDLEVKKP